MKSVYIGVAHHKESVIIQDDVFHPIHVGAALSDLNLGIPGDNTGDNISESNPLFCELTATYWIWKNVKADYAGLCHYRRYFSFEKDSVLNRLQTVIRYNRTRLLSNFFHPGQNVLFSNQIESNDQTLIASLVKAFSDSVVEVLDYGNYDIIAPSAWHYSCANNYSFFSSRGEYHIRIISEIIKKDYPDLYPYWTHTLCVSKLFPANMVVLRWDLFDGYCRVLFGILFKHLEELKAGKWCIDPYEERSCARISGYLAELLTSSYIDMLSDQGCNMVTARTVMCV